MPRATNAVATKKRRKRILEHTRGFFGNKSRLYRYAVDAFWRAGCFAYRDRRKKKSEFRQLWIVRINAACRPLGMPYCRLIAGLNAAKITLSRKSLSELAIHDPEAFAAIVEKAKAALAGMPVAS
ncbi:MAG: 50S ribosomal protein L20 [Puniceicoccales bacterium]|jgi:large subunit ribosomal protein L20|nr:50S ribosomal protein L20 [Puniceicoccales bacterium]